MDVTTMTMFFALCSVVALLATAVVVAALVRRTGSGPLSRLAGDLGPVGVGLAGAVAVTCTAGSLYYSEVADFVPCELCWFQRIAMYPLALVLVIATLRRDRSVGVYGLPLALGGAAVSVYHYQLQRFPDQGGFCSVTAPCSLKEVEQWGVVTIPFMAFSGFVLVAALLLAARVRPAAATDATARSTASGSTPAAPANPPAPAAGPDGRPTGRSEEVLAP